jgi:Transglutaminase-like superfamily
VFPEWDVRLVIRDRRLASIRRPLLFAASWCLLIVAKRHIQSNGLASAKKRFMRPWPARTGSLNLTAEGPALDAVLDEIDTAVQGACEWLPTQMTCLPRSITSYVLANAVDARPVHHIGVRARPYFGHAWTCVGRRVVGDEAGPEQRSALTVVNRFPSTSPRETLR